MNCPMCNKKISMAAKICPYCQSKLEGTEEGKKAVKIQLIIYALAIIIGTILYYTW
jgi:predicted nucleic acid-binding Zn ribbon protein